MHMTSLTQSLLSKIVLPMIIIAKVQVCSKLVRLKRINCFFQIKIPENEYFDDVIVTSSK